MPDDNLDIQTINTAEYRITPGIYAREAVSHWTGRFWFLVALPIVALAAYGMWFDWRYIIVTACVVFHPVPVVRVRRLQHGAHIAGSTLCPLPAARHTIRHRHTHRRILPYPATHTTQQQILPGKRRGHRICRDRHRDHPAGSPGPGSAILHRRPYRIMHPLETPHSCRVPRRAETNHTRHRFPLRQRKFHIRTETAATCRKTISTVNIAP